MDNKTEYLKKLHGELLEIMDVIAAICDNNNLSYYLTGGSLLGAIRHKGFIPWDDDLDIVMPRDDYERFINLCSTQLPEQYYLDWHTTNSKYHLTFAKICRKNTKFVVENTKFIVKDVELGIGVDVFPLDETMGYGKEVEYRRFFLGILLGILRKKRKLIYLKGIRQKVLYTTASYFFSVSFIMLMISFLSKKDNGKHTNYYTNFASNYPVKRWTMEKKYFEKGRLIAFENKYYKAPSDYTSVLESIFGKNYMNIPPEEKRRTHYPLYVKFSDGMEMKFDIPKKMPSIKESIT